METEDVEKEQISQLFGGASIQTGNQVSHLREAVNDDKNCVAALRPGESSDKVHPEVFPRAVGDWQWAEDAVGRMAGGP